MASSPDRQQHAESKHEDGHRNPELDIGEDGFNK
jgi:hypothetical protein